MLYFVRAMGDISTTFYPGIITELPSARSDKTIAIK